jgi:hypothetical protein
MINYKSSSGDYFGQSSGPACKYITWYPVLFSNETEVVVRYFLG